MNKSIAMYHEMQLVAGKDIATGAFAKSFHDINVDEPTDTPSIPLSDDDLDYDRTTQTMSMSSSQAQSSKRKHRKRRVDDDEENLGALIVKQMASVAEAIGQLNYPQTQWAMQVHAEVMKVDGFDEDVLDEVAEYLVRDSMTANMFMAKSDRLKKKWIENYLATKKG